MALPINLDFDKPKDSNVITLKWLVILHIGLIAFILLIHFSLMGMHDAL